MAFSDLQKGTKTGLSVKLTSTEVVEDFFKGITVFSLYNNNLTDPGNVFPLMPLPADDWAYAAVKFLEKTAEADSLLIIVNEATLQALQHTWLHLAASLTGSKHGTYTAEPESITDAVRFEYDEEEYSSKNEKGGSNSSSPSKSGAGPREEIPVSKARVNVRDLTPLRGVVHELPIRIPAKYSGQQENCFLQHLPSVNKWLRKSGFEAKLPCINGDRAVEKQLVKEVVGFGAANVRALWGTTLQEPDDAVKLASATNLAVDGEGGMRAAIFIPSAICDPEKVEQLKGTVFTTGYLRFLTIPNAEADPDKKDRIRPGPDFIQGLQLLLNCTMPELLESGRNSPEQIAKKLAADRVENAKGAMAAINQVANERRSAAERQEAERQLIESKGKKKQWAVQAAGVGVQSAGLATLKEQLKLRLVEAREEVRLLEEALAEAEDIDSEVKRRRV